MTGMGAMFPSAPGGLALIVPSQLGGTLSALLCASALGAMTGYVPAFRGRIRPPIASAQGRVCLVRSCSWHMGRELAFWLQRCISAARQYR